MSAKRTLRTVYALSGLLHGGLWFGVQSVEAPPPAPPPPMRITIREVAPPPEPEPPKPPEPEPEATPEPEAPQVPASEAPPPPEPAPTKPKRSKPEPAAEPAPAAAADAPEFGVELGGAVGPGGLAVPSGDSRGSPGGASAPKKRVESKAKKLEAPKPTKADGCEEKEVKPKPLELPQPKYTDAARAAGIEGAVRVQLSISATGEVTAVKVLQSLHPELDLAAEKAVRSASFAPATRCGAAVATTITISIKFSL